MFLVGQGSHLKQCCGQVVEIQCKVDIASGHQQHSQRQLSAGCLTGMSGMPGKAAPRSVCFGSLADSICMAPRSGMLQAMHRKKCLTDRIE